MSCCIDDLEQPTLYHEHERTARKAHRCCECWNTIQPGARYVRITGVWDGQFETYKQCEPCNDLAVSLYPVACVELGQLAASYRDYLEEAGLLHYDESRDEYRYPENHILSADGTPVRQRRRDAA